MKQFFEEYKNARIEYFIKGEKPALLVLSGTHGDEYHCIRSVKKYLEIYEDQLPDFLFIPFVSPTAVKQKTRVNELGFDTNRKYFDNSNDPEVIANIHIIKKYKFDLCVDFHEDPDQDSFYTYDSGGIEKQYLDSMFRRIKKEHVGLMTGYDDPADPGLGFYFKDGYKNCSINECARGDIWKWGLEEKVFKRIINPEIPVKVNHEVKDNVVKIIFEDVLLKTKYNNSQNIVDLTSK
jgi:hypothetical protein